MRILKIGANIGINFINTHIFVVINQYGMKPLAERMRPTSLENYIGQKHLVGEGAILRKMVESGNISSFILWGPPGVGKTTLARIVADKTGRNFFVLSAVSSSVKDVRDVIERAEKSRFFDQRPPILFIDEIHRFNKSQQDSLLAAVENGTVVLIGATTENPSFEVITPLLSRCQVYVLKPLEKSDLITLIDRTLKNDILFSNQEVEIKEYEALLQFSGGDARKLLNAMELVIGTEPDGKVVVTNDMVSLKLQENPAAYDKQGEMHYDIISAFIKSIRGSDPDAAVYWLARMVEGGEDPKFIARRLMISAAEDIGLANPNALLIANACFESINKIGWPEARIALAEATIYLASSPKSNSAYNAVNAAISLVKRTGNLPVPLHLRNAPTSLMRDMQYGKGYKYPHDFENHFVEQEYLPDAIRGTRFWDPQPNIVEGKFTEWLRKLWKR